MKIYGVEMTALKISKDKVTLIGPGGDKTEMSREEYEDRKTW